MHFWLFSTIWALRNCLCESQWFDLAQASQLLSEGPQVTLFSFVHFSIACSLFFLIQFGLWPQMHVHMTSTFYIIQALDHRLKIINIIFSIINITLIFYVGLSHLWPYSISTFYLGCKVRMIAWGVENLCVPVFTLLLG